MLKASEKPFHRHYFGCIVDHSILIYLKTNGRQHHVFSFPKESRLAGTTIISPDPFKMANQDQDRSDGVPDS
jgi:hypothetical protein